MEYWTEQQDKRLRAAAAHKGASLFVDVGARDALRLVIGVKTALGVLRARRRYAKRLRKRLGHK